MHMVTGMCDICGHTCDSATDELNALTCTFAQCDSLVYHQDCLEKFLKSIKCEKCAPSTQCVVVPFAQQPCRLRLAQQTSP